MRILHYYPENDSMIAQHVTMLTKAMGLEAENHQACKSENARTLLQGSHYDILHLHGCWRSSSRTIVHMALRKGTRLVITPHGGLEPWVQDENYWKEKLPKQVLFQKDIVKCAYAVIIQGSMERECMEKLGWNKRLIVVRNSIITSSITKEEMARQTFAVYQKVMDSNPLERMTAETRTALRLLLMAGITGDQRWLSAEDAMPAVTQWRELLCFAQQEEVMDVIERGIRVMGLDAPDLDMTRINYFLPDNYQPCDSIQHTIGNQFVTENDRLIATFRMIRRLIADKQLRIKHLVELDRELRQHESEEELLSDMLKERKLWKLACRSMQLMNDMTGLTEGFMPVPPLNDRITRQLRNNIYNNLKI